MSKGAKARNRKHIVYSMCGVCKKTSSNRSKNKFNQLVCTSCERSD